MTVHARNKPPLVDAAQIGLFVFAGAAALYVAADLLIPLTFAILMNVLLSPAVRAFGRVGVAPALSAAILVSGIMAAIVATILALVEPAENWLRDAPKTLAELESQLQLADGHLAEIQELADGVEKLSGAEETTAQPVIVQGPGFLENLVGGLPSAAAFLGIVVFLSFFLLASGDGLLRRITHCGRTWTERRRIVSIARHIQSDLSRYLLTVTAINAALGTLVGFVLAYLGVPNPVLWGVTAALLNYAPYVGAMATLACLTLIGFTTFDSLAHSLAIPASFLVLTIVEGQLVTPAVLGKRMSLSPVAVFVAVVVWGWLWGIAGALMAVPILTCLKVICDHVPALEPVGGFLRREAGPPVSRTHRKAARPGANPAAGVTPPSASGGHA